MAIAPAKKQRPANDAPPPHASQDRLYQELARKLIADLASGKYAVGDRLPAERELSAEHGMSRPTVRDAIIALEVQGLVEVRVGSGAYVRRLPGENDLTGFDVTGFEVTEARLLIEGEAAALAATQITDAELDELSGLVRRIADENLRDDMTYAADHAFHLAIARAGRNAAMVEAVQHLWRMRAASPESALLNAKARTAKVMPVVEEHAAIVEALRSRDPARARAAMRAHLAAVLEHLLFATEAAAVEEARRAVASQRARLSHATAI